MYNWPICGIVLAVWIMQQYIWFSTHITTLWCKREESTRWTAYTVDITVQLKNGILGSDPSFWLHITQWQSVHTATEKTLQKPYTKINANFMVNSVTASSHGMTMPIPCGPQTSGPNEYQAVGHMQTPCIQATFILMRFLCPCTVKISAQRPYIQIRWYAWGCGTVD